mmetsp:Transcript_63358/g.163000  ORF Transcript_63358/g.163000 Transcript_63358/m.163000 type:complete len:217 (+) Transcript_63358:617-1267(+)
MPGSCGTAGTFREAATVNWELAAAETGASRTSSWPEPGLGSARAELMSLSAELSRDCNVVLLFSLPARTAAWLCLVPAEHSVPKAGSRRGPSRGDACRCGVADPRSCCHTDGALPARSTPLALPFRTWLALESLEQRRRHSGEEARPSKSGEKLLDLDSSMVVGAELAKWPPFRCGRRSLPLKVGSLNRGLHRRVLIAILCMLATGDGPLETGQTG